jgi:hypothetical protein
MKKFILMAMVTLWLSGCTSIKINPVAGINTDEIICIIKNPGVNQNFVEAYKASIESVGYQATIKESDDGSCVVTSNYSAHYGMHWGMYLASADLKIFKNKTLVGQAIYNAPRSDFTKHGRITKKIDTLVLSLFPR